jgi:hypothetical protein
MSAAQARRLHEVRRALLACVLAAGLGGARAQVVGGDAAAKAKLVATLARFVQWPPATFESDSSPLRLCVFSASSAMERAFQAQASIGGRPAQIVVNPHTVPKHCEVVFFDESGALRADQLLRRLGNEPVFTVGTRDGFVGEGGMVEIVRIDNALRFDVNLTALRAAGLGVNPGVLKLARDVTQQPR